MSETQGGVVLQGGHGEIESNTILDTLVFDGVDLISLDEHARFVTVDDHILLRFVAVADPAASASAKSRQAFR